MLNNRHSIRLKGYDYSSEGAYFVTICTNNKQDLFGEIVNGQMYLNECGRLAQMYWQEIPMHFNNGRVDQFVIMPNHMHGIVIINRRGEALPRPYNGKNGYFSKIAPKSKSLGVILWSYKSIVAKKIRIYQQLFKPVWQRNYFERVIRNDAELNTIRQYIQNNPQNWNYDENNLEKPTLPWNI